LLEIPPTLRRRLQIEGDLLGVQPRGEIARAGNRQMSAKNHSIEALEHPIDFLGMLGNKGIHGVASSWWYGQPHAGGTSALIPVRTTPLYSFLRLRRSCGKCSSWRETDCRSRLTVG